MRSAIFYLAPIIFQQLPDWQTCNRIALYLATDGEIDTGPLARLVLAAGKALYLPVIQADRRLLFARWDGTADTLVANKYGIGEPGADSERVLAADLDCIALPLVAWSPDGTRLGMGGGYYDRTLADADAALVKIGLGYELQRQDILPGEDWDIKMDFVATEAGLYPCASEER